MNMQKIALSISTLLGIFGLFLFLKILGYLMRT